jgi:hypothetical protein
VRHAKSFDLADGECVDWLGLRCEEADTVVAGCELGVGQLDRHELVLVQVRLDLLVGCEGLERVRVVFHIDLLELHHHAHPSIQTVTHIGEHLCFTGALLGRVCIVDAVLQLHVNELEAAEESDAGEMDFASVETEGIIKQASKDDFRLCTSRNPRKHPFTLSLLVLLAARHKRYLLEHARIHHATFGRLLLQAFSALVGSETSDSRR